ncbi:hypothetical protein WOB59_06930 [Methylocystis sp. IM4]|uniref:hypothetical protein n=1 Tax=Methylocystis sp. IM4 TaxID=3136560 RepID=UPI0031195289
MLLETLVLLMTAAAPARTPSVLVAPAALFWRTPAPLTCPTSAPSTIGGWRARCGSR